MVKKMNDEIKRIKTPTTFEEQLDILQARGMQVEDMKPWVSDTKLLKN